MMMRGLQHNMLAALLIVAAMMLLLVFGVEAEGTNEESTPPARDRTERWSCVTCTILAALVSQVSEVNKVSAKKGLKTFCNLFPVSKGIMCKLSVKYLCPQAFRLIDEGKTPDEVCTACQYCSNPTCHLFPLPKSGEDGLRQMFLQDGNPNLDKINVCKTLPGLCSTTGAKLPTSDADGDFFSVKSEFRGSNWRGRDCNDKNSEIYPGRDTRDEKNDENCNGIYGTDKATGKTYEDLWCTGSGAMGVIAVGDSATAGFGIPGGLLNVSELSKKLITESISTLLENEFDWPMLSYATGFTESNKYAPARRGPMTSIYSELVKRNRCNHRDYQNIGVNGAETKDLPSMMDQVARDKSKGVKPAIVILSFIGNDVCDISPTTPTDYFNNIMAGLAKANDRLPPGSHAIIAPVADGRILYNTMHNRIHPVGSVHNDVTYANFYDFLNCLEASPCPGWLNTNESVRNSTWAAATALNDQIPNILKAAAAEYTNIKVHYLGDGANEVLKHYENPLWELINPVDGFHPSQIAHALLGKYYSEMIIKNGIAGPENQFNDAIKERFGDQGGY